MLAPAAEAATPAANTGAVTGLHFSRATLNGTVNPDGAALEECVFEYGETTSYGETAPCAESSGQIGSGSSPVPIHADIGGLSSSTGYHFRLRAKNADGSSQGTDTAFATLAPPEWKLTVRTTAEYFIPDTAESKAVFFVEAENVGADETSGPISLENTPPAGTTPYNTDYRYPYPSGVGGFQLAGFLCSGLTSCGFPGILEPSLGIKGIKPGEKLVMVAMLDVPVGTEGTLLDTAKVSGGGAPTVESGGSVESTKDPTPGHIDFSSSITNAAGEPYTQAGGHPFKFVSQFDFGTVTCANENPSSWEFSRCPLYDPKNVDVELPPGLIANPQGVPHCDLADYFSQQCADRKVAVGTAGLRLAFGGPAIRFIEPVLNLQPAGEYPGQLGILVAGAPFIVITTGTRDGSDYGITSATTGIQAGLNRVRLELWGVPADHSHDAIRAKRCEGDFGPIGSYHDVREQFMDYRTIEYGCESSTNNGDPTNQGGPAEVPPTPFLTMPTQCSGDPLTITGRYDTWQLAGQFFSANDQLAPVDGCNALSFEPKIEARPTTNLADAPSGFELTVHVPQNEDPEGIATPQIKDSVIKLPAGVKVNPASADGLVGCTEGQASLGVQRPAHCPEASKLGTAEINTPLLREPLVGGVYLATPAQNPAGALLGSYLILEGQGTRIKLPGEFETDPGTGQITAKFLDNPQLPFEDLKLKLFGGASGILRTPATCGSYETTASLTPYSAPESGPPATPSSSFKTTFGPQGGDCPQGGDKAPYDPVFHAGTETPRAGAYSPFALRISRDDGTQEISRFDLLLPPGLTAKLAGIPYCSDAAIAAASSKSGAEEHASPSCSAASEVGSVDIASGAGPIPIFVSGRVYLAGPYKGAPLSLAFVTPVLAGPFDLGTTVVRAAVHLDPETVQNHVVSDPLPTILRGIPLDIRSITVKLDRPKFMLNPTSCDEFHLAGGANSLLGSVAPLSERFQVGDCGALHFKPRLSLSLSGAVHRNGHPRLRAVVTPTPGGANLSRTQVTLPPTEFVDNGHLRDICSNVQFEANACPETSIYGRARAETPLLSEPLEGPVFLQPSTHRVPDLVASLSSGEFAIKLHLHARQDSVQQSIRTTFEGIPDVPLTRFVLNMDGGKKGLLVNSKDLCAKRQRLRVRMVGQNSKVYETQPLVRVPCGKTKGRRRSP